MRKEVEEKPSYAVVAAVQLPTVSDIEFEASLNELRELAKTLGYKVVDTFIQKRAGFDTTGYLGVGKRQEIADYVSHGTDHEIDAILVDHEISPSQSRNLEKETGCAVMYRTMVILEIFHNNARSRAAKAQVEIARLGCEHLQTVTIRLSHLFHPLVGEAEDRTQVVLRDDPKNRILGSICDRFK